MAKKKTIKRPAKKAAKKAAKRPAKIGALRKKAQTLTAQANKLQKKYELTQKIKTAQRQLKAIK